MTVGIAPYAERERPRSCFFSQATSDGKDPFPETAIS